MAKQIGYAVLGLGTVALRSVLPAFAAAGESSRLIALVSGDRAKAQTAAQQFRATPYHYDQLRQCLQREDVHAVYIALPTSLHCDYAVEAARVGVHVLCETPMAVTADECRRMIRTCQTNRVKLMLGYRVHFRPAVQKAISFVRTGHVGMPKTFSSDFTRRIVDPESTWLQRRLGGGSVYHLGVEAIAAARSMLGIEPAQVMAMTARTGRRFGGDVDEGAVALVRFPDERLAHLHTSFGEEHISEFTVYGEEGWIRVSGAYDIAAPSRITLVKRGERQDFDFDPSDEVAAALNYFSSAVRDDRVPEPSGVEGLEDVRIIEAIYRSARDGRPVTLPRLARVESGAALDQEGRSASVHRRQAG
jgi:predicted dehydrogenase